jgi:predicted helicase
LKNLFGFEYLIAPYTIAHLKLSQYLRDLGYPLKGDERLQVFLTNTVEPVAPQANFLLPAISAEVASAQRIKDRNILVIVGNPPYAYESKNIGAAVTASIEGYKYTIERTNELNGKIRDEQVPLGERNPRGLNDDYVKFIRFAQLKMDTVDEGIVGIITNHAWLDNATFRGMRQSLMRSFQQIYVIDLHGNAKKKERSPDGSKDENVFDIEQGVAITLFVKQPKLENGVWRADFWGKRLHKYQLLADTQFARVGWKKIVPRPPQYLFKHLEEDANYDSFQSVPEIFVKASVGIVTGRDEVAIHFSEPDVLDTVRTLCLGETAIGAAGIKMGKDSTEWKLADVVADVRSVPLSKENVKPLIYRPFDTRYTYKTGASRGLINRPRNEVWTDFDLPNLGLVTLCLTKGEDFAHALVTTHMIEKILLSSKTSNNAFVFPIYVASDRGKSENLSATFRTYIDTLYDNHYSPEEILSYIYAVLHTPTYREKYAEFLRIDFPRIPFPESADAFDSMSGLGWELVQAHLLRELPRQGLAAYHGKGDHTVEAVRYSPEEQAISINKTQFFKPVPQAVGEFHIGGYQVLDKYLKSRKGRPLTLGEIDHVAAIADSLAFTINQMAKIDRAYTAAFPNRG